MSHDVYICYDEEDKNVSDAICHIFEENNIKPWVKSKNMSSNDSVDKIINAISNSKCFILILSKQSRDTTYVITETDLAFSRNIPILVFSIDELKLDGNLEFILENQDIIPSFPNSKKQLEDLVKKTSEVIGKPYDKLKIDSKSLKVFEKINPKRKENTIKKCIKISIPLVTALILIYFFIIIPTGQNTTDDGIFSMNVTNVEVSGSSGNYKYTVFGESYNLPSNSSRYFMNIKFFDKNNYMVYEVNSTADEFKLGIICSCELHNNNVTHIDFKLTDIHGNLLCKDKYAMKIIS